MCSHTDSSLERAELMTRCMGSRDFALRIVARFRGLLNDELAELERSFAAGDLGTVEQIAHRLRGAAGMVAARRLSALCGQIEELAAEGGASASDEIAVLLEALRVEECLFLQSADSFSAGTAVGAHDR